MTARAVAALVVTAMLLTACGSTVQRDVGSAAGDVALDDTVLAADPQGFAAPQTVQRPTGAPAPTTAPPAGATSATGAAPSQPGPQAAGSAAGGAVPAPSAATAPSGGGGPDSAAPAPAQPDRAPTASALHGVTDEAITIGYAYATDQNEGAERHGMDTDFADWRQSMEAMVEWVNANGGVNGRDLAPYYHPYSTPDYVSPTFYQSLCTSFTQDQEVYLALPGATSDEFLACMANAGTPTVTAAPVSGLDAQAYEEFRGFLYQTGGLDLTQQALLTARGNVANGHLTPSSTVGVITFDQPSYVRSAEVFEAELAQHGIAVAETALIRWPGEDFGQAQLSNTALRFRSQDVDRVAVLESNGVMWASFAFYAETQLYRPDYVINPSSGAQFWADRPEFPVTQHEGARGVAIQPVLNVHRDSEPHPPAGRATCREIFDAAGLPAATEDYEVIQLFVCEQVLFLKAALDRATDLSPLGLQAAVESLGRTYQPAMAYTAYFGPGFHTGAGSYFELEYVTDCSCYRMTSDIRTIPGIPE